MSAPATRRRLVDVRRVPGAARVLAPLLAVALAIAAAPARIAAAAETPASSAPTSPPPTRGTTPAAAGAPTPGGAAGDGLLVAIGPTLEHTVAGRLAPEFARVTGIRVDTLLVPSPAALRPTATDGRTVDVVVATDPELLDRALGPAKGPTFTVFAANAMVVGYRRESAYGRALDGGRAWFEALRAPGVRFGRPDPALDPLGARTVFVLQLARTYYDAGDLVTGILRPDQIVPAADLIPRLQRGELDVALTYRNAAVDAGLAVLDLPVEIDLADPGRRGVYDEASLEVNGDLMRGAPIVVVATTLRGTPNEAAALRFVDFLGTNRARQILDRDGFVVMPGFPIKRAWGEPP